MISMIFRTMTPKKHGHSLLHGRTVLGERGQIVIPQGIREGMGIKPGDEMVVIARDHKIIIVPGARLERFYEMLLSTADDIRRHMKKTPKRRSR